ncbi:Inosine-uridine preferring nucleoside hydrolase [Weissella viridescens]|uniref:Inosine-uridine preferring nucleoside hydrolase n=1 Tax=Weissella viridescens TaxID=1629 RepID=A0A380NWU2_WEIVI|nr:Inosine-uridine preferring nucleoside hydrolase [Weissella viridescens]
MAAAARPVETTPAVDFMIESAHAYQDNLIIVPTGPLTNLAAAMQKILKSSTSLVTLP